MSNAFVPSHTKPWNQKELTGAAESIGERVVNAYDAITESRLSPGVVRSMLTTDSFPEPYVNLAPRITKKRDMIAANIELFCPRPDTAVENQFGFLQLMLATRWSAGSHPFDPNQIATERVLHEQIKRLETFRKFGMKLLEDWEEYAGESFIIEESLMSKGYFDPQPMRIPEYADEDNFRLDFTHTHDGRPLGVAMANWLLGSPQSNLAAFVDLVVNTTELSKRFPVASLEFLDTNANRAPFTAMYLKAVDLGSERHMAYGEVVSIAVGDKAVAELYDKGNYELWELVLSSIKTRELDDVIAMLRKHPKIDENSSRMDTIRAVYRWADEQTYTTENDLKTDYRMIARTWLSALGLVGA